MRLVDDDDIGVAQRAAEIARPAPFALQVGVVVAEQIDEAAVQVGQQRLDRRLPHVFPRGFRSEEDDVLCLLGDEPLDEYQPDVGLAEADAVAQECAAVFSRDASEVFVGVALILRELAEDDGLLGVPLVGREFVSAEEFVQ